METSVSFAGSRPPRALLVEDDPVSRHYLEAVLQELGLEVDTAADGRTAHVQAASHQHALWMIDVNLPDISGPQLLAGLRDAHGQVTALAHTADSRAELGCQLRESGFADVLVKPISRQTLLSVIQNHLPGLPPPTIPASRFLAEAAPVWDDAGALNALNGQQAHLKALRELFLNELPGVHEQLVQALSVGDHHTLRQHLHRLQASCSFVGAARLADAARDLHRDPDNRALQREALEAITALLPE